jgi:hypothetical protein
MDVKGRKYWIELAKKMAVAVMLPQRNVTVCERKLSKSHKCEASRLLCSARQEFLECSSRAPQEVWFLVSLLVIATDFVICCSLCFRP